MSIKKRLHKEVAFNNKVLKLTKAEEEILRLLTEEFLTVKQISYRRKCTHQAIYKIINKLKKKGAFNIGLQKVAEIQPTMQPNEKIRLHGQEFNIKLLYQDQHYQELLKRSNIMFIDGNTIRLYRNSIEIYAGKSFYGENEQIVTTKSLAYWKSFFIRLEHILKSILVKPRAANIKLVNQHYAYIDSEICESSIEKGERIRIYAKEDGKLAFITDDSFGFKEDETVHSITAKQDRKAIDKQINDWRLYDPPTNSELLGNFKEAKVMLKESSETQIMLSQVFKQMENNVIHLTKIVGEFK